MRQTGQTRCRCGAALRSDNRTGACRRHVWIVLYERVKAARKRRKCESCARPLRPDCEAARCLPCRHKERADTVALRQSCELCGVAIRSNNRSGRCLAHREQANKQCGCGASIKYDSEACVRCSKVAVWETRRARATKHCVDCREPLRSDNTTGLCKVHWTVRWKQERREKRRPDAPGVRAVMMRGTNSDREAECGGCRGRA
jgi:hypothetical protein